MADSRLAIFSDGGKFNTPLDFLFNANDQHDGDAVMIPSGTSANVPTGTTSGEVGVVYGYKSGADYWVRVIDLTGPRVRSYHVVNGVRTSILNIGAPPVTPGSNYVTQFTHSRRELKYNGTFPFGSAGLPSGRVGFFTTIAGASCSQLTFEDDSESRDTAGRWQGWVSADESNGINTYRGVIPSTGRLEATFGYSNKGWLADNLRLQRFQAVFRVSRDGEFNTALDVLFNANDPDDADAVTVLCNTTAAVPTGSAQPTGATQRRDGVTSSVSSTGTLANAVAVSSGNVMWVRVRFDGTTLAVREIGGSGTSTAPTDSAWSAVGDCMTSTGYRSTGGRIGFRASGGNPNVDELTIKSDPNADGTYPTTELYDNFTVNTTSGSPTYGFAQDTLAYDNAGNLTYDGTQAYTYDAWNRLMTVSHAYRDASGTLQHGHAVDTMSYDAKGRRVIKAVIGTGSWDCTYHDYYSANWQLLEERNGSNQPVRQNVWGRTYVDELVQTTASSDPTSGTTTLDHPYYAMQDANWNVLGVVNAAGALQERYEYTPYGMRSCFFSPGSNDVDCYAPILASRRLTTASGTQQPWGVCENGHQGMMGDEECGTIQNRRRDLRPGLGRMNQRDPLGYVDGMSLYEAYRSDPIASVDPSGTDRYITGVNPFLGIWHASVAVDIWSKNPQTCKWVKTNIKTYDFSVDWNSRFWWLGLLAWRGRVTPSMGLNVENPIKVTSTHSEDQAMKNWLDAQVANPPIYSGPSWNCWDFAEKAMQIGMP